MFGAFEQIRNDFVYDDLLKLELVFSSSKCLHQNNKQDTNYIERDLCSNETSKVDPEIQKLLKVYDTIFMNHKWNIVLTRLTKHDIITEGPPVLINPRRQPVHQLKQILDRNI